MNETDTFERVQASFDAQFNNSTFSTLMRPKYHVQENEQKRQSAIEEENELMRLAMGGGLPEHTEP
jgi:hypothetical protein